MSRRKWKPRKVVHTLKPAVVSSFLLVRGLSAGHPPEEEEEEEEEEMEVAARMENGEGEAREGVEHLRICDGK